MLNLRTPLRAAAMSCALMLTAGVVNTACAQDEQTHTKAAPDNSKVNKTQKVTADQQKDNASDRDLTKRIRQAVVADKSLSTYGHNVKIIAQNGMVTLKGPVHSDEEKQSIGAKATEVAGEGKVTNQLMVKK